MSFLLFAGKKDRAITIIDLLHHSFQYFSSFHYLYTAPTSQNVPPKTRQKKVCHQTSRSAGVPRFREKNHKKSKKITPRSPVKSWSWLKALADNVTPRWGFRRTSERGCWNQFTQRGERPLKGVEELFANKCVFEKMHERTSYLVINIIVL